VRTRILVLTSILALALAACGGGDDPSAAGGTGGEAAPVDGPTITVASFNFTESTILAELYAQALEDAGFPVDRQLDLGSREVINPELFAGELDLLPEYVGSALQVGFGVDATADLDESLSSLREQYEAEGITVLEPAPGEDKNVYVVTGAYAEENGLETISDLADVGEITFAGAPECETRETCFLGLTEGPYMLDNLSFTGIPEGAVRISSLENGEVELIALFSTQPVISEKGFVPLDDDQGLTPVENIVPVVSDEVIEAYGEDLRATVNEVTELITTEALLDLNGRVELDAQDPADVAADFLSENGITG
jgi:osmoprotectant transport system substrate-binding protein